jgi:uncharacterized membrane protein
MSETNAIHPFQRQFDIARAVCYDGTGRSHGAAGPKGSTQPPVGKEKAMEEKGFLGALFDLSFSEFVTTRLVKILYILLLILVAIGLVIGLITSVISLFTRGGFLSGLMGLIFTPIGALIWVIMARVWMEIIIVVFRIAENTSDLVQMKKMQ